MSSHGRGVRPLYSRPCPEATTPSLSLLLVSLLLLGGWAAWKGRRRLATVLLAPGAGLLLYGVAGILLARLRGTGRFYSVPFGGERVTDGALLMSLLVWVGLMAGLVWRATRPRGGAA